MAAGRFRVFDPLLSSRKDDDKTLLFPLEGAVDW